MADRSETTLASGSKIPTVLRRIGDYDVTGVLGRGGFGVVYAAEHRDLGHRRAIKVLAPELAGDDEMIKRFSREAKIVNVIDHPSIIHTLEVGRLTDGRPYFVMDRVDGLGLHEMIRTLGPVSLLDAVAILAPVCEALDAAHAAGVVHRDLKAANLIVAKRPSGWRVWLADFGIAKLLDPEAGSSTLTLGGQRLGTPEYMAPEQVGGGEIDGRTDVYALGVLLFHMLTGDYPFRHVDPTEIEQMHVTARPALEGVAPALSAVLGRALEKLPRLRYPTAGGFLDAVREAAATGAGRMVSARSTTAHESTPTRSMVGQPHGEIAVAVIVSAGVVPPDLDPAALTRSAAGSTVELRTLDDGTVVCLIRAPARAGLADEIAQVAFQLRRGAPDAAIAIRLAAGGATDLHLAFNAAMAAVATQEVPGAIGIEAAIAERLAGTYPIEWRGKNVYLVPGSA